jgi:hypothetical protein
MDPEALGPEEAALLRSRLHVRGARRRLRQGRVSPGLAALYDALTSAVDWYLARPERRARLPAEPGRLGDDLDAWAVLARAGVVGGAFDFPAFRALVFRGLDAELPASSAETVVPAVEAELARLGVLPFDEGSLPPEDPATP